MENTLENRNKFAMLYYGQKVAKDFMTCGIATFNYSYIKECGWPDCLELSPLSEITDEDAIEVAKMKKGQNTTGWISASVKNDNFGLWVTIKRVNGEVSFYLNTEHYLSVDYLRSKGYALPYMNLSVDQQIGYGWVKLKTT